MRPILTVVYPEVLPLFNLGDHRREVSSDFDIDMVLWDGQRIRLARIERGFITDGVSRPWWAGAWVKHWDQSAKAAVLHDWHLELVRRGDLGRPKFLIDLLFLLALVATGVSFPRALLHFLAVRVRPIRTNPKLSPLG